MSFDCQSYLDKVKKITKREPVLVIESGSVSVFELVDYPSGCTTLITYGISEFLYTMWRGCKSGFELTLTVTDSKTMKWSKDLINTGNESIEVSQNGTRRPQIEYNGVFAPGYAPHLFFCEELTQSPKLSGQQKVGDKYIRWLASIPISDAELRIYDRSPLDLISELKKYNSLTNWETR